MTLEEAIKRYTSNSFYEKSDGNLQGYLEFNQLAEWLKELKQLREQTQWIPVSERLPEKEKEGYIDFYKCLVAVKCTSRNDIYDSFTAYFDGEHFYEHLYDRAFISGVKAWQPLPRTF